MLKNRFFTVFCVCSGILMMPHAGAQDQVVSAGVIGGPQVNTTFTNFRSTDAGVSPETIFDVKQKLTTLVTINVDANHVGKAAAIFIVARYNNAWFMKNEANQWVSWDTNPANLVMNTTIHQLGSSESVLVEQKISNLQGQLDVYVGYKLDNTYTFNTTPFAVSLVTGKLNDTGVFYCANATQYLDPSQKDSVGNLIPFKCPINGFLGQDGEYGRDATNDDDSDGEAGFSFTKMGSARDQELPVTATAWSCVRDNVTGLLWENKTPSIISTSDAISRLHSQDNTYSWYNTNAAINGAGPGIFNGGACVGSSCDTDSFVKKVNETGLCGYNDGWRLPTKTELLSIVDNTRYTGKLTTVTDAITKVTAQVTALAAIDPNFFPNTPALDFWTSAPMAGGYTDAWSVYFYYGSISYNSNKNNLFRVRLVRG